MPNRTIPSFCFLTSLILFVVLFFSSTAAGQVSQPTPGGQPLSSTRDTQRNEVKGYTLPPEKYARAVEYARARYRLHFISVVYGVAILLMLLHWRIGPRYRDLAERASTRRFVQAVVFAPLLLLTLGVVGLPTDIYRHWLALKYDQSIQGWGSWLWDWTKGQFIGLLLGALLIWILYAVIPRSPRRWWFYFGLAALPILVLVLFISPVLIDPLFFKFEPLAPRYPQLAAGIETVVQHGALEIPRERMFEMKASEKLKSVNAYVTGIGASKRVVVWDTTIARMTTPQTLFVFGHEMGHYVLGHIRNFLLFGAAISFVFLYLGYRALAAVLARWGGRWAIRGVADWASLPVLLLLFSLFGFFAEPVVCAFSRYQERQADVYGLEVIHGVVPESGEVAAQAFQVLGEIDLSDPDPPAFITFWLYTHPPLNERVVFVRAYDPWSKGQPPQFVK